jgi:DNA-binding response OmpR family regulator
MKLLIIDDEQDILEMIQLFAQDEGIDTKGMLRFERSEDHFDAILADIGALKNAEIYDKIGEIFPNIPIYLMTGDIGIENKRYPILYKPFDISEMILLIKKNIAAEK